jgi:hypothetical protein
METKFSHEGTKTLRKYEDLRNEKGIILTNSFAPSRLGVALFLAIVAYLVPACPG